MVSVIGFARCATLAAGFVALFVAGAAAQVTPTAPPPYPAPTAPPPAPPPPALVLSPTAPSEPGEIQACLCLQQAYTALAADMNAKKQAYDAANQQVSDLNAQLARERASVNVNNPDAVARVKALLERRDAAANSLQPAYTAASQATARYNARVNDYNARCANRPFNSALVVQIQTQLTCPPLQ